MAITLSAITQALKDATAEEARAWVEQVQLIIDAHKGSPKKAKAVKVKNSEGPKEWNIFVKSVQKEMAAESGVIYDSFSHDNDDKAFKEAAKNVGATWLKARKEAMEPKAVEPKEKAKAKAKVKDALEDELAELNMEIKIIDGKRYAMDSMSHECFIIDGNIVGDRAGIYDIATRAIDTSV